MAGTTFTDPILLSGESGSYEHVATGWDVYLMLPVDDLRKYYFTVSPATAIEWKVFSGQNEGGSGYQNNVKVYASRNKNTFHIEVLALDEFGGRAYVYLWRLTTGVKYRIEWTSEPVADAPYTKTRALEIAGDRGSVEYTALGSNSPEIERWFSWTSPVTTDVRAWNDEPWSAFDAFRASDGQWLGDGWTEMDGTPGEALGFNAVANETYHIRVYSGGVDEQELKTHHLFWESVEPPYIISNDNPETAKPLGWVELTPGSITYDNTGATDGLAGDKDIWYSLPSVSQEIVVEFVARPSGVNNYPYPTLMRWSASLSEWEYVAVVSSTTSGSSRYVSYRMQPGQRYALAITFNGTISTWEAAGALSWRSNVRPSNSSPNSPVHLPPGDGQVTVVAPPLQGTPETTYYDVTIPLDGGASFTVDGGAALITAGDGGYFYINSGQHVVVGATAGETFTVQLTASQVATLSWGVSQEIERWTDWYEARADATSPWIGGGDRDNGITGTRLIEGYGQDEFSLGVGSTIIPVPSDAMNKISNRNVAQSRLFREVQDSLFWDRQFETERWAVKGATVSRDDGMVDGGYEDGASPSIGGEWEAAGGYGLTSHLGGMLGWDAVIPNNRDMQRHEYSIEFGRSTYRVTSHPEWMPTSSGWVQAPPLTAAQGWHRWDYLPIYAAIYREVRYGTTFPWTVTDGWSPLAYDLGPGLMDPLLQRHGSNPIRYPDQAVIYNFLRGCQIEWSEPDEYRLAGFRAWDLSVTRSASNSYMGAMDQRHWWSKDPITAELGELDPSRGGVVAWLDYSEVRSKLHDFTTWAGDHELTGQNTVWDPSLTAKGPLAERVEATSLESEFCFNTNLLGGNPRPDFQQVVIDKSYACYGQWFKFAQGTIDWAQAYADSKAARGAGDTADEGSVSIYVWPNVDYSVSARVQHNIARFYPKQFRIGIYKPDFSPIDLGESGLWADVIGVSGVGGNVADNGEQVDQGGPRVVFERLPGPVGRTD